MPVVFLCLLFAPRLLAATHDVVTFHNNNYRSGWNERETILTHQKVNSAGFGKLFSVPVDGVIDAQPLFLSAVKIPNHGIRNVVYAVTENDSVYAFNAENGTIFWQVSLLRNAETPSDTHSCGQIGPQIGITSTPVIDRASGPHGTIYIVAMSRNSSGNYFQRLHALDVTTGDEQFGGPVAIAAKYPGTGDNSQHGYVIFDPYQYAERAGLLLLNHVIYTAWTSHCDQRPYTGWIIGYDESTLKQTSVLNVTPNGNKGAIWQSGGGLAAEGSDIFFLDGNGVFDTTLDAHRFPIDSDYGNAFLKVSTTGELAVTDYFEMDNSVNENNEDVDLGSGGAMLMPPMKDFNGKVQHLAIGAGKDTNIYIVEINNMGRFNPGTDAAIYQQINGALPNGVWSVPAAGPGGSVYFGPVGFNLLQFQFKNARLSLNPVSQSPTTFPYHGASPSVSSNGETNGIVWAIEHTKKSVLHAYDATNLANELYNSNQANSRDHFGEASHFGTPTIANGKVYIGTTDSVAVFGLLP